MLNMWSCDFGKIFEAQFVGFIRVREDHGHVKKSMIHMFEGVIDSCIVAI